MTDREAMKMALEVLERASDAGYSIECEEAITALRQALAKPEKEPMSFQTWRSRQHGDPEEIGFLQALKHAYESGQYSVSPPRKEAEKSELEKDAVSLLFALRDAWPYIHGHCTIESIKNPILALIRKHGDFVDLHPSQKEWVSLTEEDIEYAEYLAAIRHRKHIGSIRGQLISPADNPQWHFAKIIEAELRKKNT